MVLSNGGGTYFEFTCILPAVWEELWNWFCFEKGALGVQTIKETSSNITLRIFFNKKPVGGGKMLVDFFQKEISKEIGIKILTESLRRVKNWQENWRENFKPIKIGKTLIVLPSWDNGKVFSRRNSVWIEPGQSFGTGHHISTILALETLEKELLISDPMPRGMIDIGIGSGILSIAACRLGIKKVVGVDIDQNAIEEVERNSKLNGFFGRIKTIYGQPSYLKKSSSLVICNMLKSEILDISEDLLRLTCPRGTLICSGIMKGQDYELIRIFKKTGFFCCSTIEREKWCAIKFKRIEK